MKTDEVSPKTKKMEDMLGKHDLDMDCRSFSEPIALTSSELRQQLIEISDNFTDEELGGLKFFLFDYIPVSKLERAESPLELFEMMKKCVLFDENNLDFILEILGRLHRFDLVRKLGYEVDNVKEMMPQLKKIFPFRILEMELAEDIDDKEFQTLKFLLAGEIKKRKLQDVTTVCDLLIFLQREGVLSEDKPDKLLDLMKCIKRPDLEEKVLEYLGRKVRRGSPPAFRRGTDNSGRPNPNAFQGPQREQLVQRYPDQNLRQPDGAGDLIRNMGPDFPQGVPLANQGSGASGIDRRPIDRSASAGTITLSETSEQDLENLIGDLPTEVYNLLCDELKDMFGEFGNILGYNQDDLDNFALQYPDNRLRTERLLRTWQDSKEDKGQIVPGLLFALKQLGCRQGAEQLHHWILTHDRTANGPSDQNSENICLSVQPARPYNPEDTTDSQTQVMNIGQTGMQNAAVDQLQQQLQQMRVTGPIQPLQQTGPIQPLQQTGPIQPLQQTGMVLPQMAPQQSGMGAQMPHQQSGMGPQMPHQQSGMGAQMPHQQPGMGPQMPLQQTGMVLPQMPHQQSVMGAQIPHQQSGMGAQIPHQQSGMGAQIPHQQSGMGVKQGQGQTQVHQLPAQQVVRGTQILSVDELPSYPMTRKPRGWCVIINNEQFFVQNGDAHGKQMPPRIGTAKDAESLTVVFEKLNFVVRRYDNLSDTEMMQKMVDVSHNVDHKDFDCLVVCILTHGVQNHLFGVNGRLVSIKDVTSVFQANRCPTLRGKPKLFFLQACQGREKMEGADIERDGPAAMLPDAVHADDDPQDMDLIPNEADFLLGYATVPGYVSFRSRSYGSWYIRKLCELLDKHALRHDLMSILTEVNRQVALGDAKMDGGRYKQIPAPFFTLRKKLLFI